MLELNAKALADATRDHKKVLDAKSKIPALTALCLAVWECGYVELTSTDLETELTTRHQNEGRKGDAWRRLIPAASLLKILSGVKKADTVTLEPLDNATQITLRGVEYVLPQPAPPEDFPNMACVGAQPWSLPAGFADALRFVSPAMSVDGTTRSYFHGACLYHDGRDTMGVVASDGHFLLHQNVDDTGCPPVASLVAHEYQATIPYGAVTLLADILDADGDSGAPVVVTPASMCVVTSRAALTFRLVDSAFPDWLRVIPDTSGETFGFTAEGEAIAEPLSRMVKVSSDRIKVVKFDVGESLRASVNGHERGNASANIRAETHGEGAIAFTDTRLLAALAREADAVTRIDCSGPHRPVRVSYPDRPDRLGVLLPLRA